MPRSPSVPVASFYFAYLGALGLFMPYFTLYLASLGLGDGEVTRVLAVGPACGLIAPPLVGLLADALGSRARLLRVAAVTTAIAFAGFLVAGGSRVALYGVAALFALCRAPLTSLVDSMALEVARRGGPSYGALRLWGSLGFLFAVMLGGQLLDGHGARASLWPTTIALALAGLAARFVSDDAGRAAGEGESLVAPSLRALGGAVRRGGLGRFLGAVVLAQVAGSAYDGGLSLHLARLGHTHAFIGLAWATGVVGEVALLAVSGRVLARVGAKRLFTLSLGVAALRWLALAFVRRPALLLLIQPLHGVTFGFFYVAATRHVRDRSGAAAATTGQGLLAAALALGSILGMSFVGELLAAGGGRLLFAVASLVALAATVVAAGVVDAATEPAETLPPAAALPQAEPRRAAAG